MFSLQTGKKWTIIMKRTSYSIFSYDRKKVFLILLKKKLRYLKKRLNAQCSRQRKSKTIAKNHINRKLHMNLCLSGLIYIKSWTSEIILVYIFAVLLGAASRIRSILLAAFSYNFRQAFSPNI